MSYSVTFNGVELNNYINVLVGFTPYIGADWQPSIVDYNGIMDGGEFQYTKFGSKTIPMPFLMQHNLKDKYDALEKILNVDEPKRLIFGSQPDRYYMAIPSGTLDYDQICDNGGGTITWIIPDGLAHAVDEKEFTATMHNGILTADIYNGGVDDVPVSYEITNNHENGFVGIVSQYGVLQLGNIQEVDQTTEEMSEELFRYQNPTQFNAMTNGQGILTEDFPKNGTWGYMTEDGEQWLSLSNPGTGTTWHGASKYQVLPNDSSGSNEAQNFYCQSKIWYETGLVSQTGLAELVIGDTLGNHLASVHLVKSATNSNTANAVFKVQGKEMGRVQFTPSNQGPTTKDGGKVYIRKTGQQFDFYFGGGVYSYRVPAAEDAEAMSVTIFLGNYGSGNAQMTRLYFKYLFFQKNNVQYQVDIPNRYPAWSVIEIDGEAGKITVDGVPSQDDEVRGSVYFTVPPGHTVIEFYYSSFSNPPPSATAIIREAYL